MYRKKHILPTVLFTSMVSLVVCGVCDAGSDTMAERRAELAALQAENASFDFEPGDDSVVFPGMFQDLSKQERMDVQNQSYKPFFNRDAYRPINIKDDTAVLKAKDCAKIYECIEQYGKAEREAEDAYFKAVVEYYNAKYFKSAMETFNASNIMIASKELLKIAINKAEMAPCLCVNDMVFAKDILQDLNMACTDEKWNQVIQSTITYITETLEGKITHIDDEWKAENDNRTYNEHEVTISAAVLNEAVPTISYNMRISSYYDPENYHNSGKCEVVKYDADGDSNKQAEESLFIGNCYGNDYVYIVDSDGNGFCSKEHVCILGKSCAGGKEKTNFCWWADTSGDEMWGAEGHADGAGYELTHKCSGGRWTGDGPDKIPVFVDKNGKVIKTNKGYFPQSIVGPSGFGIDSEKGCIAKICSNGTYGCPDGTCIDAGAECTPGKLAAQADPWNMSPIYKNTVKPYLDVLSKCKSSAK